FKPIVYAAALERGWSLGDRLVDEPVSIAIPDQPNWEPSNFDLRFTGDSMTLYQALQQSKNSIAVKLGQAIGSSAIVEAARRFRISTPIPSVPSISLGSPDVFPIEMVAAYSVLANLGYRTEPNAMLRIDDRNGQTARRRGASGSAPAFRRCHRSRSAHLTSSRSRWLLPIRCSRISAIAPSPTRSSASRIAMGRWCGGRSRCDIECSMERPPSG